jgi:hypothetical protein
VNDYIAHSSNGRGIVTGGIDPCRAIISRSDPRYASGTVSILRGMVTWKQLVGAGRIPVFPHRILATAKVGMNGTYRFVVAPGRYVLKARLPHSSVRPFVQFTVKPSAVLHVDIPNMCM